MYNNNWNLQMQGGTNHWKMKEIKRSEKRKKRRTAKQSIIWQKSESVIKYAILYMCIYIYIYCHTISIMYVYLDYL